MLSRRKEELYRSAIVVEKFNYLSIASLSTGESVGIKIRYRSPKHRPGWNRWRPQAYGRYLTIHSWQLPRPGSCVLSGIWF